MSLVNMAPVTSEISARKQDRFVFLLRFGKPFVALKGLSRRGYGRIGVIKVKIRGLGGWWVGLQAFIDHPFWVYFSIR